MGGFETLEEIRKKIESFRFVVLYHTLPVDSHRQSHWDLLLETHSTKPNSLLCFEANIPPDQWKTQTWVNQLPNHRPIYLNYEGPISNNRGHVQRVLQGTLNWICFGGARLEFTFEAILLDGSIPMSGSILLQTDESHSQRWKMAAKIE